jgi:hypothetical protein
MDHLAVIERVYEHLESDRVESAVMACLRLARNLNDHLNAAVFLRELRSGRQHFKSTFYEDTAQLKEEVQKRLWEYSLELWLESRTMRFSLTDDKEMNVLDLGAGEIEAEIPRLEQAIQDMTLPAGLDSFDAAAFTDKFLRSKQNLRLRITALETIKATIKSRCLTYCISLERQLEAQNKTEVFLHQVQTEVNNYFKGQCEDVYIKLQRAAQLVTSENSEDGPLLLTEVRRSIKAIADYLYPASVEPVRCADGNTRKLDDEKYLNRLEEYVAREFPKGTANELLEAELRVLVAFVRRLNDIASKGVHVAVRPEEAKQGLVGLYMFLYNLIGRLQLKQPAP